MAKIKFEEIGIKVAGVSAGAVLAKFADKLLPNLNPTIRGVGKIAIGAVVPAFLPKQKIVEHVGTGFIAVGAMELATNFIPGIAGANDSPMAGIGSGEAMTIEEDFENVSGVDDDDDIAGANDDPMAGVTDDGYDIAGAEEEEGY